LCENLFDIAADPRDCGTPAWPLFAATAAARGLQRTAQRRDRPSQTHPASTNHAGAPRRAAYITSLRKWSSFQSKQEPACTGSAGSDMLDPAPSTENSTVQAALRPSIESLTDCQASHPIASCLALLLFLSVSAVRPYCVRWGRLPWAQKNIAKVEVALRGSPLCLAVRPLGPCAVPSQTPISSLHSNNGQLHSLDNSRCGRWPQRHGPHCPLAGRPFSRSGPRRTPMRNSGRNTSRQIEWAADGTNRNANNRCGALVPLHLPEQVARTVLC